MQRSLPQGWLLRFLLLMEYLRIKETLYIFAHEIGTNAVVGGTTTAIPAFIRSGDYSMHDQQGGDAEFLLKVRRFIPDFKVLNGDAKVTLFFSDYPVNTASSSNTLPSVTGPFTISTSTDKVDTRVRGRLVSLKIENDAINQSWRYGTLRLDVQPMVEDNG
jgi:hypothetical protein